MPDTPPTTAAASTAAAEENPDQDRSCSPGNNAPVWGSGAALSDQERQVLEHNRDGLTAYRLVAPGILLGGEARVTVQGDWWHAEQDLPDGTTIVVDAEDELGTILALVGKQRGLAVVVGPDDGQAQPAPMTDDVAAVAFNAVSQAIARAGRFLSLTERRAVAEQVVADLRDGGWIA